MNKIELLLPAKDLACGKTAVSHGADAVYMGAPKFGARKSAGNTLQQIDEMVQYAHLYGSKVYVTVNTLVRDSEVKEVERLLHGLYNAGVDAVIVQDMGILKMDMPPIALHASTQCHNNSVEQIRFLEKAGFRRAILAREMDLESIQMVRKNTSIELETFVHGALCVCYSGQCYMSLYLNGRSGNRGECAQVCRQRYSLLDADGRVLQHDKHLLSLRDMNRTPYLAQLLQAGICSLKVEGRLKDVLYVKNITALYRKEIDAILENNRTYTKTGSGTTRFFFTPDSSKTFNRGFTSYFLTGEREKIASFDTPKAMGEYMGVMKQRRNRLYYEGDKIVTNGDGLCFINRSGELEGFFVNGMTGNEIIPHKKVSQFTEVKLFRNQDRNFEKALSGKTAERKIPVDMVLSETESGIALLMEDEDGLRASSMLDTEKIAADRPENAMRQMKTALAKLGNTPFELKNLTIEVPALFLPVSVINGLRTEAAELLKRKRVAYFRPQDQKLQYSPEQIFKKIGYKRNVVNRLGEAVYRDFGAEAIEYGLDLTRNFGGKELMECKYCLRYELGCCSRDGYTAASVGLPWYLTDGRHRFRLDFDCGKCCMRIIAES